MVLFRVVHKEISGIAPVKAGALSPVEILLYSGVNVTLDGKLIIISDVILWPYSFVV